MLWKQTKCVQNVHRFPNGAKSFTSVFISGSRNRIIRFVCASCIWTEIKCMWVCICWNAHVWECLCASIVKHRWNAWHMKNAIYTTLRFYRCNHIHTSYNGCLAPGGHSHKGQIICMKLLILPYDHANRCQLNCCSTSHVSLCRQTFAVFFVFQE